MEIKVCFATSGTGVGFVVGVDFSCASTYTDGLAAAPCRRFIVVGRRTSLWRMITLKIAMPVLMAPSQTQETNPVQHVLRENGCSRTTKV